MRQLPLGQLLRAARLLAGLTQQGAARQAQITQAYLSMIERGKAQPSAAVRERLSALYHLDPDRVWTLLRRCGQRPV
jgi:transcriptional regulator with XRE-family HTH domain